MKKMKVKGQKWLKGIHIFFACIWIGAGFCLILTQMGLKADSGGTLHGIDVSMKFIDDFIIIQVATLIFAAFISVLKPWKKNRG